VRAEFEWSEPQRFLADRVFWAYASTGVWPVFQWIQAELWRRGDNALALLESFPTIGGPWAGGRTYCDVFYERSAVPSQDSTVRLSIRGISQIQNGAQIVQVFIAALNLAAEARASAAFDPTRVVAVELTSDALNGHLRGAAPAALITEVFDLMQREPLRGILSRSTLPDAQWRIELGPEVIRYRGLTIDGYLAQVDADLSRPPEASLGRVLPNPLDLATAFTYLDTTWRLHNPRPLLNVGDLAAVTSLAFPAANGDEYSARCSALGDILKSLQCPSASGVDGHAVHRLHAYLKLHLEEDDRVELDGIVTTLESIRRARDARAHSSALAQGQVALEQLGVPGPPFDWPTAWAAIQSSAATALMDLRAVVARLPRHQ
jgi:hypothetical protein